MFNPLKGLGNLQQLQAQAKQMQQALQKEEVTVEKNGVVIVIRGDQKIIAVEIDGIIPQGSTPGRKRVLNDVKLLMEASSSASADIVVTAEYDNTLSDGSAKMSPSRQEISRNKYSEPCWNDAGLRYVDEPEWIVPGDYWIKPDRSVPVTGFYHRIQITFPSGHPIRLKAILLSYGDSEDVES